MQLESKDIIAILVIISVLIMVVTDKLGINVARAI
jgi:hypothetical protein